jgi:hypothetical protein
MAPPKRKAGGRVTPKGTKPGQLPTATTPDAGAVASGDGVKRAAAPSSRYTPPAPKAYVESPRWVPIVMFTLLGLGMLVIILNYLGVLLPGAGTNNWWLLAGLLGILGGIITATQYR